MNHLRVLILLSIFFFSQEEVYSMSLIEKYSFMQDTTILAKKKIKKSGFLKRLFHHSDSSKRARKFIHQQHRILKDKEIFKFPTASKGVNIENSFFKTEKDFELGYEVFGWYPYWEKEFYRHINFSLLSTVSYFSYEINPSSGEAISTHGWETTSLIDSIRTYPKKRILLTVTNFGERNNNKFLKNSKSIDKLIENLIELLAKRKGDGICIDFEGVSKKNKDEYTGFLLTLSKELKKANKYYQIYVTVPSVNWSEALDFKSLVQAVDKFVIMGYDYYGSTSNIAGPVSPILSGENWEPYNLTESVKYYLDEGILNSKLILALPTYGSLWETENQSLQSKAKKFLGSKTYSYIQSEIEKNVAVYIEPVSKSAYSTYRIRGSTTQYRQCWFENDSSFFYKTKLIKENKLAGLGLWALGYDKGYDDIWRVIYMELSKEKKTAEDSLSNSNEQVIVGPVNTSENNNTAKKDTLSSLQKFSKKLGLDNPKGKINTIEKVLATITNYKTILLYIMWLVLLFGCLGFLSAMMFPNTRSNFFNSTSLKLYYSAFLLFLAIIVFRMQQWIDNDLVILIIGFILGASVFYISNTIVERRKKELP